MNKFKKISLGIVALIVLFVFGYSCFNVIAEEGDLHAGGGEGDAPIETPYEISQSCQNLDKDNALASKYSPKLDVIEQNGVKYYKITVNPYSSQDTTGSGLNNVRFNLYKSNGELIANSSAYVVYYNHPLLLDYSQFGGGGNVDFAFKNDPAYKDPDCTDDDMKYVELDFNVSLVNEGDDFDTTITYPPIEEETLSFTSHIVNCNNKTGDFDEKFCLAKEKAQNAPASPKVNYTDEFTNPAGGDVLKHPSTATFTCDSEKVYDRNSLVGENYYTPENVSYLFGSGNFDKNYGKYTYHLYGPDNPVRSGDITCKVRCEEAVTVEYGTPVASKAGLCFEYKVRVTSRVSCQMIEAPDPPTNYSMCTPGAVCTGTNSRGNSYTVTEGGPNDSFDACIMDCDGGKYTSKCSKKCYSQIYKNTTTFGYKTNKNAVSEGLNCNDSSTIKSVDDATYCNESKYKGYYYKSGSSIYWSGSGDYAGRWYFTTSSGSYPTGRYNGCKSNYIVRENGICRHDHGTWICNDKCWWKTSCLNSYKYLNPYYADADYKVNKQKYENAKKECQAAATCSTSTAEFTISVDYKDGAGTVKTVDFPYNQGGGETDKSNYQGTASTFEKNNSTLISEYGCYQHGEVTNNQLYSTEWGFPGSWVNKKTGELSYLLKQEQPINGWQKIEKKFCIPFDAQDVNVKWWNYYYTELGKNIACPQTTPVVETYNIRANTTNFGYFGWNIGIKCFYAINNTEKQPCDPPEENEPDDIKYVIRSIDLENVFPATNGDSLSDASDIGRVPGFNWSSEASNAKNIKYQSSPLDYAKRIQERGYTIYSNEEQMDYKFRLTPAVLKELRTARSTDYTQFYGDNFVDENGVIRYKSDLLDDLETKDEVVFLRPGGSGQICNNTKHNGNTWTCESHQ